MFCLLNSNVDNFLPDLDINPSIVYLIELLTRKFNEYVKKEDRKFHNLIFMQTYFATKENHTILIKSSNNFDQFLCLLWLVFSALILRRILMQCTLNMNDNGVCRSAYNSVVKTCE